MNSIAQLSEFGRGFIDVSKSICLLNPSVGRMHM